MNWVAFGFIIIISNDVVIWMGMRSKKCVAPNAIHNNMGMPLFVVCLFPNDNQLSQSFAVSKYSIFFNCQWRNFLKWNDSDCFRPADSPTHTATLPNFNFFAYVSTTHLLVPRTKYTLFQGFQELKKRNDFVEIKNVWKWILRKRFDHLYNIYYVYKSGQSDHLLLFQGQVFLNSFYLFIYRFFFFNNWACCFCVF